MHCQHLRDSIRRQTVRGLCGLTALEVYGCTRFGECTLDKALHGRRTCRTCGFHTEAMSLPSEGEALPPLHSQPISSAVSSPELHDVTFGIVTFRRPKHCRQLVESILRFYPLARIIVADNGDRPPELPECVDVFNLPFNCEISASRNALVRATVTEYFLLLDDDTVFHQPVAETFLDVLRFDRQVGVAVRTLNIAVNRARRRVDQRELGGCSSVADRGSSRIRVFRRA